MIALREGAKELNHEHFHGGIMEVAAKKKSDHFVRQQDGSPNRERSYADRISSISAVLCLKSQRPSISSLLYTRTFPLRHLRSVAKLQTEILSCLTLQIRIYTSCLPHTHSSVQLR